VGEHQKSIYGGRALYWVPTALVLNFGAMLLKDDLSLECVLGGEKRRKYVILSNVEKGRDLFDTRAKNAGLKKVPLKR